MGCFKVAACFGTRKRSKTRRSITTTRVATLIEDQNICHGREINEVLGSCLYSSTGNGNGNGTGDTVRRIMTVEIIKNDSAELEELKRRRRSNQRKKVAYHADMMMNPLVEETHMGMGQEEETCRKGETSNYDEIPILFPNSIQEEEKSVSTKSKDYKVDDDAADSSASSLFTYPTSHRYHNCTTSDDESEVTGLANEVYGENADTGIDKGNNDHQGRPFDGDNAADIVDSIGNGGGKNDREGRPFDGESVDIDQSNTDHGGHPFGDVHAGTGKTNDREGEGGLLVGEEESSESLFSLSIDSRKKIFAAEIGGEKEVSSPFKLSTSIDMNNQNATESRGGQCIHSVLNPIENNMSQWRALEKKTISSLKKDQEKENLYQQELKTPPQIEELVFKNSKHSLMRQTRKEDENAVDTSLSSWLKASGKSKTNENSPVSVGNSSKRTNSSSSSRSFDDGRTILGALTLDELKQQSRFSAPRYSPSPSPKDIPIIGTVGSYWMHTGQCIQVKKSSRKTSSKSSEQCIEQNSSTPSRNTSRKPPGQCA